MKSTAPKREQAIILNVAENLKLFDYVKSIGDILGPKNITYASRISNNRVCIYLASKTLVEQLIETHPTVMAGDTELSVRRLVTPAKRIVLSNISPSIDNEDAESELKKYGLNLVSPVTSLRAGMPKDDYGHILSFRRQAYIMPPNDNFELQTSILMPCEGRVCRVFISTDKMECFICRQPGHKANTCPNTSTGYTPLQTDDGSQPLPPETIPSPTYSQLSQPSFEQSALEETNERKRAHEASTSASVSLTPSNNDVMQPPQNPPPHHDQKKKSKASKPATKKLKKDPSEDKCISDATKVAILETYQKDPGVFTVPFEHFIAFLENSHGCSDPYTEALRFTTNVKALLKDMHKVYPVLKERCLKYRFTRVTKKIKASIQLEGADVDSVMSITSMSSQEDFPEDFLTEDSQQSY